MNNRRGYSGSDSRLQDRVVDANCVPALLVRRNEMEVLSLGTHVRCGSVCEYVRQQEIGAGGPRCQGAAQCRKGIERCIR